MASRIEIKQLSKKLSQLEYCLLHLAKAEISKNRSLADVKKVLISELEKWKNERIKYRNTPTKIDLRFPTQLYITNSKGDAIHFIYIY